MKNIEEYEFSDLVMPERLTLFNLFHNRSKFFFPFLGLVGIINGIWGSALLLLINNKISGTPLPYLNDFDWLIYIALIFTSFIIAAYFQSYMIKLTHKFGIEMRLSIFNKLRFTQYEAYTKLGEEKLRTALQDVSSLQTFPGAFIQCFNAGVMTTIGLAYLFWISPFGTIFVIVTMLSLIAVYLFRNKKIRRDLDAARLLSDIYHKNVIDFVRGFKEVKMSIKRSDNIYYKHLTKNRVSFLGLQIRALVRALGNELLGTYAWYIIIGTVLFILPVIFSMSLSEVVSFLVILLFLMGPVNNLIGTMESFIKMNVALDRLNNYNEIVASSSSIEKGHGDLKNINNEFKSIVFEDIVYEYFDDSGNRTFQLAPLNLEISKGEIIFITGGNGSGKSTFINLLSGLYEPKSGQLYLNDHLITTENKTFYRNQLACVFTDNYLFENNYSELDLREDNQEFVDLLTEMNLHKVVRFDKENNKVSHKLSKGQQKRMALIYAILEDKDVFIFDEWAAEQDPEFRRYFYHVIIPKLKRSGKTIIAVTHDDAYFNCAERIIKFDFGKVAKDQKLEYTPEEV